MKTKWKVTGNNWEFDGQTITVRIPMQWKRRGGRKVIVAPDGGDAWAPTKPRPDETLIRALARAHRWATDNSLTMFVVLNCGIFGLVVHIL